VEPGSESIPRLYTRTGDHGTTGLSGGARVAKDSARLRAYGAYDELGAALAVAVGVLPDSCAEIREVVRRLQHELFIAQAELARAPRSPRPEPSSASRHVERLEKEIDTFDARHPTLNGFVLPGGSPSAAAFHVARTVARRAERELVTLNREEPVDPVLLAWANRLSDLLFALALATNAALGVSEVSPRYDV